MDLLSESPFSPLRYGLPADYPPLEADASCDVVVIGAGITGALVSFYLAEAGAHVVTLDRRDVGHGSTAGSTGFLQYEIDLPLHRLVPCLGEVDAVESYHTCRDAVHEIAALAKRLRTDVGHRPRASVFLARSPDHVPRLAKEFAARERAGFDVEWWDRRRLRAESTLPNAAAIVSAKGDAGEIDAYRFTHCLLAAAHECGAKICDRTRVTRIARLARGVRLTTDRGTRVRARYLVIASGYESDAFLPEPVTTLHSTFALVSEPVGEFTGWPADRALIWDTGDPYAYLRTTSDGRIMMGGYDEEFRDPAKRDRMVPEKTAALVRRFRRTFPQIEMEVA